MFKELQSDVHGQFNGLDNVNLTSRSLIEAASKSGDARQHPRIYIAACIEVKLFICQLRGSIMACAYMQLFVFVCYVHTS